MGPNLEYLTSTYFYHLEDITISQWQSWAPGEAQQARHCWECRDCCGETAWTQLAARSPLALSASCLQYDQVLNYSQLQDPLIHHGVLKNLHMWDCSVQAANEESLGVQLQ